MALKLSVKHPEFPDDQMFHITGLGSFKNGSTTTLTKEQEEEYHSTTGHTIKEGLGDSPIFSVDGTADFRKPSDAETKKEGES